MADNKQYITQAQENGTIQVSEEVIATIVSLALGEVEGVAGLSAKNGMDINLSEIAEIIGIKSRGKGLKITITDDDTLYIDCYINVLFGQSVIAVATAVQEAVTSAVESTLNIKVAGVNVNVCGIVRQ